MEQEKKTGAKVPAKKEKTLHEQLVYIQQNLKANKGQENEFGHYKYRSCEDILEAVKPLLGDCTLTLTDNIVRIGDRYYVKATAVLTNKSKFVTNSAFAREAESKKGMDESQITGATSSYARKYALNGLFCIDDEKDADTKDNTKAEPKAKPATKTAVKNLKLGDGTKKYAGLPTVDDVCDKCGEKGRVNPNTLKAFCPEWEYHREQGDTWTLLNKQDKAFDDDLKKSADKPESKGKKTKSLKE